MGRFSLRQSLPNRYGWALCSSLLLIFYIWSRFFSTSYRSFSQFNPSCPPDISPTRTCAWSSRTVQRSSARYGFVNWNNGIVRRRMSSIGAMRGLQALASTTEVIPRSTAEVDVGSIRIQTAQTQFSPTSSLSLALSPPHPHPQPLPNTRPSPCPESQHTPGNKMLHLTQFHSPNPEILLSITNLGKLLDTLSLVS